MIRLPERLGTLTMLAALSLPALLFFPHSQHAFWATEHLAMVWLMPPAALLAMRAWAPDQTMRPGIHLFQILAGIWLLSAAFSLRTDLAARELAGWFCYPLAWVMANQWAKNKEGRDKIITTVLAVAALQSTYGIIQSAGWEPAMAQALKLAANSSGIPSFGFETLNWAVSFAGRAGAFLGNPNFLGGHLALVLPLALAHAMDDRRAMAKIAGWMLAALCAAGLVVTQTRGAWLGAGIGIMATLWISHHRMPGLLQRNKKGLASLGLLGAAAIFLFFATHKENIGRIQGIFKGDEEISRRLTLMQASLKMAARHPLLGVGPGNFRIHFPAFQMSGLKAGEETKRHYIYSEHAHNDLIQMAAETGLASALLFGFLVFWAMRRILAAAGGEKDREVEREAGEKDPLLASGIFGGLLALLVHGLANFPFLILPTQATAWALAGLAMGLGNKKPSAAAGIAKPLLWAGTALWLFAAYHAGRNLQKDALWWVGQGELGLGNHDKGREVIFKTLELDRREDRLWYQHAQSNAAESFTFNAVGSLKAAVKQNPHYVEAQVLLGKYQIQLSQWKEALQPLQQAAMIAPNYGPVWEPLAAALYMNGDYEQAVKAYDWALAFQPPNAAELLDNKAAALGSLGRYQDAILALTESEAKNPNRAKLHINKAITYFKMGYKAPARDSLKKAKALDPKDPQLKDLEKAMQ